MRTATILMAASIVALAGATAIPSAAAEEYTVVDCVLRDDGHPPEHCVEDCTEEPYNPLDCRDDH